MKEAVASGSDQIVRYITVC